MAIINSDNRSDWQALADSLAPKRPSAGKHVRVTESRKYKGITGTVIWHGTNKFFSRRYETEAQGHLRDMEGRRGFRIRIQPDSDCDVTDLPFYVDADKVEVL